MSFPTPAIDGLNITSDIQNNSIQNTSNKIPTFKEDAEIRYKYKPVQIESVEYVDKIIDVPIPKIVERRIPEYFEQDVVTEIPQNVITHVITEVPIDDVKIVEKIVEKEVIDYVDKVVLVPTVEIEDVYERSEIEIVNPIKKEVVQKKVIWKDRKIPTVKNVEKIVTVPVERQVPRPVPLVEYFDEWEDVEVPVIEYVEVEDVVEVPVVIDVYPMALKSKGVSDEYERGWMDAQRGAEFGVNSQFERGIERGNRFDGHSFSDAVNTTSTRNRANTATGSNRGFGQNENIYSMGNAVPYTNNYIDDNSVRNFNQFGKSSLRNQKISDIPPSVRDSVFINSGQQKQIVTL